MVSKMNFLFFVFILSGFLNAQNPEKESDLLWLSNLDEAQTQAKKSDNNILVYFSGSDWCRPCQLLRLEVFDKKAFKDFADENLVLVQFDFPARAKNKLPEEQQELNDKMAERFNKDGVFPKVLVLNKDTSVLGEIDGYRQSGMDDIIGRIKKMINK